MLRATYVGRELPPEVRGKTCLVRRGHACGLMGSRSLLVQFDDRALGVYAHGWWDVDPLDLVLVSAPHVDGTVVALQRVATKRWMRGWGLSASQAQALVLGASGLR